MKKLFLCFVLLAVIVLGTMTEAKANPVTFYVEISLSDTCSPSGYNGYYCVRVKLTYYGTTVCTATNCRVVKGTDIYYAFTCDFAPVLAQPGYNVVFIDAARYPSGDCYTTNGSSYGNDCTWENISSGSGNCAKVSVTL